MSEDFQPDALGRLYVQMPDEHGNPGKPQPVLAHMLGYALSQGYRQCAKPSEPGAPAPSVPTIAPEPVRRAPKRKAEVAHG